MEDELVNILIPRKHLARTYVFVGSLDASEEPAPTPPATDGASAADSDWPRDLIERQFIESPPAMKEFQKWLADHPGQEFSTREIAEALGADRGWNTIAGMLGAYGHRVASRYRRTTFPFRSRTDHGIGQVKHSMTPEVAEIIKALV